MSTAAAPADSHQENEGHESEHLHGATPAEPGAHAHPSDGTYIVVGLVLAALTAIEVGLYYLKGGTPSTVALVIFMLVKFFIVVGFFMHLRFDSPVFRRLFAIGLGMATFVYTVTLFTFGVFHL
jgi:cytochrome c oxidase subunit IV